MRGSGDSEGFYYDEYEKQEQDDCCDVIGWISQQAWCTGNVGKFWAMSVEWEGRKPPGWLGRLETGGGTEEGSNCNSQGFGSHFSTLHNVLRFAKKTPRGWSLY